MRGAEKLHVEVCSFPQTSQGYFCLETSLERLTFIRNLENLVANGNPATFLSETTFYFWGLEMENVSPLFTARLRWLYCFHGFAAKKRGLRAV